MSLPLGSRVDWLLGGFYTKEDYPQQQDIFAVNPTNGAIAGRLWRRDASSRFTEVAGFTDVTFHVTDRFDVQVGGRESQIKFTTGSEVSTGPYNGLLGRSLPTFVGPAFDSKDNALTYLVTPRFIVSQDMMVYARFASGYRPGGPNTSPLAQTLGLPTEYSPDTTDNFEVGAKGSLFGRALTFDVSAYYIQWNDIQIQLRDPVTLFTYFTNTGKARSEGLELSLEARLFKGSTITAWGAYNDAQLTEVPTTSILTANAGDRLPYSSPVSGNVSIDQEIPLGSIVATMGATVSYVDDRKGRFFSGPLPRETFPSYTQLDLHAGVSLNAWEITAFLNNATDKRGVLRAGRDAPFSLPYFVNYTQPRTMGLSASRTF